MGVIRDNVEGNFNGIEWFTTIAFLGALCCAVLGIKLKWFRANLTLGSSTDISSQIQPRQEVYRPYGIEIYNPSYREADRVPEFSSIKVDTVQIHKPQNNISVPSNPGPSARPKPQIIKPTTSTDKKTTKDVNKSGEDQKSKPVKIKKDEEAKPKKDKTKVGDESLSPQEKKMRDKRLKEKKARKEKEEKERKAQEAKEEKARKAQEAKEEKARKAREEKEIALKVKEDKARRAKEEKELKSSMKKAKKGAKPEPSTVPLVNPLSSGSNLKTGVDKKLTANKPEPEEDFTDNWNMVASHRENLQRAVKTDVGAGNLRSMANQQRAEAQKTQLFIPNRKVNKSEQKPLDDSDASDEYDA